ncbi:hypothetical protein GCM10022204_45740 [Microlunatus aurantiacus]|uniref:Uncharacterized protein n=1 Tax=Microlunatus aurantiacus TaxID=446786 RepID=A0ABP7EKT6_9ACTN
MGIAQRYTLLYGSVDQVAQMWRRKLIDECRASCILGGGIQSEEEAEIALDLGVPVVPVAATGGAAARVYQRGPGKWTDSDQDWSLLADRSPNISAAAAARLLRRAMSVSLL